jgi:hypothetical protein
MAAVPDRSAPLPQSGVFRGSRMKGAPGSVGPFHSGHSVVPSCRVHALRQFVDRSDTHMGGVVHFGRA